MTMVRVGVSVYKKVFPLWHHPCPTAFPSVQQHVQSTTFLTPLFNLREKYDQARKTQQKIGGDFYYYD